MVDYNLTPEEEELIRVSIGEPQIDMQIDPMQIPIQGPEPAPVNMQLPAYDPYQDISSRTGLPPELLQQLGERQLVDVQNPQAGQSPLQASYNQLFRDAEPLKHPPQSEVKKKKKKIKFGPGPRPKPVPVPTPEPEPTQEEREQESWARLIDPDEEAPLRWGVVGDENDPNWVSITDIPDDWRSSVFENHEAMYGKTGAATGWDLRRAEPEDAKFLLSLKALKQKEDREATTKAAEAMGFTYEELEAYKDAKAKAEAEEQLKTEQESIEYMKSLYNRRWR